MIGKTERKLERELFPPSDSGLFHALPIDDLKSRGVEPGVSYALGILVGQMEVLLSREIGYSYGRALRDQPLSLSFSPCQFLTPTLWSECERSFKQLYPGLLLSEVSEILQGSCSKGHGPTVAIPPSFRWITQEKDDAVGWRDPTLVHTHVRTLGFSCGVRGSLCSSRLLL